MSASFRVAPASARAMMGASSQLATAGRATTDKDLLRLKVYENIPIIRPVDALRTLGELE